MAKKIPLLTPIKDVLAHTALATLQRCVKAIPGLSSILATALEPLKNALKRAYEAIDTLQDAIQEKDKEIERLNEELKKAKEQLNTNSQNSNRPPSTDSPFKQPRKKKPDGKKNATSPPKKAHHPGTGRPPLKPTEIREILPSVCPHCGGHQFINVKEVYRTQHIEVPESLLDVTDVVVLVGKCHQCGKKVQGEIPQELSGTYGIRLKGFIGELHLGLGCSRRFVQRCLQNVFHLPISQGTIQNIIDDISHALEPYYRTLASASRRLSVNHIDETTWRRFGPDGKARHWLWVLCSRVASFFIIHEHRSQEAFQAVIGGYQGSLITDDYAVYRAWPHGRQTCLAHLLRYARKFSEDSDHKIALCGHRLMEKFRSLAAMKKNPPTEGEKKSWLRGFIMCVRRYSKMDNAAGKFCRRISGERETLTAFLRHPDLEPTNNFAERTLRFGVTRRKVNIGSTTEKGERLVERALSLRQTCLSHQRSFYDEICEALTAASEHRRPNTRWIMVAAIRSTYDKFQAGA